MRGDNGDQVRNLFQDANIPHIPRRMLMIGILVLLGAGSFLSTIFYQVEADEVVVVQRFGRYVRTEAPGLQTRWPLNMETIKRVKSRRVHKVEFGFRAEEPGIRTRFSPRSFPDESLMLTGDLNVADVQWIVQYRIANPKTFLFGSRDPEQTLRDVAQIVMRAVVGDHTVTEVLTERRTEIAHLAQTKMQELLDLYDTGLRVETVKMQNVTPPSEAVHSAFNEVNEAQQEKARKVNEAEQVRNQKLPRARGEAARTITQAQGYAVNRVNTAKGDVARFTALLGEYHKAPEVTRRRLYLETMRDILPAVKQVFVFDADQPASLLPFLNLQEDKNLSVPPVAKEER
ncbi:Modulator of FtsH protease HflK [Candidatus Entotheonellaceae bacterium PAL068K]